MTKLFYRRGHNGCLTLTTIPPSRFARWVAEFDQGQGLLFYAAVVVCSIGFYVLLAAAMALA